MAIVDVSGSMPQFYFNIYNSEVTIDEEGQELPDVEAARRVAIRSAREVMCDGVRDGEVTLSHWIDIEDDQRAPILTLTFGEILKINP